MKSALMAAAKWRRKKMAAAAAKMKIESVGENQLAAKAK